MPDYKKMYYILFNAVTDALEQLSHGRPESAEEILRAAQLRTEEMYISANSSAEV